VSLVVVLLDAAVLVALVSDVVPVAEVLAAAIVSVEFEAVSAPVVLAAVVPGSAAVVSATTAGVAVDPLGSFAGVAFDVASFADAAPDAAVSLAGAETARAI
jgi:hypothetical protein